MRHRTFVLCLSALIWLALLTACGGPEGPTQPAASLTVSVAPVLTESRMQTLSAAGRIEAWQAMPIGAELQGLRVAEVMVEIGDPVKAGAALLRLDARSLRMQLAQAEAALAQADAQLAVTRANAARARSLRDRQLIAERDAEEILAQHQLAQAQALAARAQRDQAQLQVEFATVRAPHAGVISRRQVEPGQVITAGQTLFELIRDGRLEWRAELPEADLLQVSTGMTVHLRDAAGETITGTVRAVAPALDPQSRTGTIYADLPTPGVLRAGMYASGVVALGERPMRTLPDAAVVERDGYRYVFLLGQDGKVAQRRIRSGARLGDAIEVLDGVADGEQVVVQGAGFLADGDRVKVAPADPATAAGVMP